MSSDSPSGASVDGPDEPDSVGVVGRKTLPHDVDELQRQVRRLEADLAGYRSREELLNRTFVSATAYAERVMEDARRDAELIVHEARAGAEEVLGGIEQEKHEAERELLRLRGVVKETRETLSGYLETAMEGLRADADDAGIEPAGLDEALKGALEGRLPLEGSPPPRESTEL